MIRKHPDQLPLMFQRPGEATLRRLIAPFEHHLSNTKTTEVCINEPGGYWVEKGGTFSYFDAPELDFDRLDAIATLAAALTQQDIGPDHPLCATTLPDGQRVQVCRPPAVAAGTVSITIRRPSSFRPTLGVLAEGGMFRKGEAKQRATARLGDLYAMVRAGGPGASDATMGFLAEAARQRLNIIICGMTGSGKTTLAQAIANEIDPDERLITIEDTPEWKELRQQNRVALFYSNGDQGTARVGSTELLEASLRMRPNRVLMQELRDGAAFTYLRAVVAGHPGSITTCHADNAPGAFNALRLMIRQHPAGATMGDADVRDLLRQMVHVVVYCERDSEDRFSTPEVLYGDDIRHAAGGPNGVPA